MDNRTKKLLAIATNTRGENFERLAALAKLDELDVKLTIASEQPDSKFTHSFLGIPVTLEQGHDLVKAIDKERVASYSKGYDKGFAAATEKKSIFKRIFCMK